MLLWCYPTISPPPPPPPLHPGTPIHVSKLPEYLVRHPDQQAVRFITEGLTHGPCVATRPRNSLSARENPGEVSKAIQKELIRGHSSDPFAEPPFTQTHCSPIGAVGKPDGSYRLILDLSSPRGEAVNEGIDRQEFSVTYSRFDDAIDIVHALGRGAYMAKIDIRHAFRISPVRKAQWPLLCYWWQGAFSVDTRLPFGSRSSPYIFTALAELLLWILIHVMGINHCIHYLDDYFCASVTQGQCQRDMRTLMATCDDLGVPLAPDKIIGPTRTLTYLGIQIDTERMMVSLPAEKYDKLAVQLRTWGTRKKCTKRELLSLIGALSFAAKVVKPGRMFLRRLIDLSTTVSKLDHRVSLNAEARTDIQWWTTFLPLQNGAYPRVPGNFISAAVLHGCIRPGFWRSVREKVVVLSLEGWRRRAGQYQCARAICNRRRSVGMGRGLAQ